jgi:hypothetical protein
MSWEKALTQFNQYQDFSDYGYIKGRLLSLWTLILIEEPFYV